MTEPTTSGPIREARIVRRLLTVIALVALVWLLRQSAAVAVPLVAAVFVALIVAPVGRRVAERVPHRAKWLGHVAAMSAVAAAIAVFVQGLWIAAEQVASRFAEAAVAGTASGASGAGTGYQSQLQAMVGSFGNDIFRNVAGSASSIATSVLGSATALVSGIVLTFFLSLLMLMETPHWQTKVGALIGSRGSRWFAVLGVVADRLRRYLVIRTALGLLTAVLYVAWLALFGIDLLLVWATLALLLNFVPTLGSLIAGVLPVLYAFAVKDLGTAIAVGAGILVIEQVMGNFVDPRIQGRQLSVSPLVVLIALLVWGWLWGIPGAILAVPITIAMIVIFAHIPALRPVALLLSNERDLEGLDAAAND